MTEKQPTYNGLSVDFRRLSQNLCLHSLSVAAWSTNANWRGTRYEITPGEFRYFPLPALGPDEKETDFGAKALDFLDHYLFELLLPKNMAPPNRNMLPRIRADLNKYRGWLLNRVLRQLNEQHKEASQNKPHPTAVYEDEAPKERWAYKLPEDLPKAVDDLYLFHRRISGGDANIAKCADLNALHDLVEPHQIPHPITNSERAYAHARFMQTGTVEELEELLPQAWQATDSVVVTPEGKNIQREKGAKLVAVLEDNTEIVHLLTKDAALAYGSPRWCTAYRSGDTYFEDYKDGLIVVMAPEGARWQLHFRTGQINDANDEEYPLNDLLREYPAIEGALNAYIKRELGLVKQNEMSVELAGLLYCIEYFPKLKNEFDSKKLKEMTQAALSADTTFPKSLYNDERDKPESLANYMFGLMGRIYRPFDDRAKEIIYDSHIMGTEEPIGRLLRARADDYWADAGVIERPAKPTERISASSLRPIMRTRDSELASYVREAVDALYVPLGDKERELLYKVSQEGKTPLVDRLYESTFNGLLGNEVTERDQFSRQECNEMLLATLHDVDFYFILERIEKKSEGKKLVAQYDQFVEKAAQAGAAFFSDHASHENTIQRFLSQLETWRASNAQAVISSFEEEERAAFIGFSVECPDIIKDMMPCIGEVVASLMHNSECAEAILGLALRTRAWNASISAHANLILQNIRRTERDIGIVLIDPYTLQDLRRRAGADSTVREVTAPQFSPNGSYDQIKKFPSAGEDLQATARSLAEGLLAKISRFQPVYLPSTIEAIEKTFRGLENPSSQTLEWLDSVAATRPIPKATTDVAQEHGCGSK